VKDQLLHTVGCDQLSNSSAAACTEDLRTLASMGRGEIQPAVRAGHFDRAAPVVAAPVEG
jgi:hypothetical protein